MLGGGFFYLYKTTDLPDPNADFETNTSFVYYSDGESELGQYAIQNRDAISYDQMPQYVKDAVVAAENRTFWSDSGIDYKGIVRALLNNAQGNATQGASTITQQYIKILYLTSERSYTATSTPSISATAPTASRPRRGPTSRRTPPTSTSSRASSSRASSTTRPCTTRRRARTPGCGCAIGTHAS
jgi:hypothetical protein